MGGPDTVVVTEGRPSTLPGFSMSPDLFGRWDANTTAGSSSHAAAVCAHDDWIHISLNGTATVV